MGDSPAARVETGEETQSSLHEIRKNWRADIAQAGTVFGYEWNTSYPTFQLQCWLLSAKVNTEIVTLLEHLSAGGNHQGTAACYELCVTVVKLWRSGLGGKGCGAAN